MPRLMRRVRPLSVLLALLVAGALAVAYVTVAPPSIGGRTITSFTYGVSMEPKLHKGDLVFVRKASSFRVGQVALYENKDLGRHVLHRIVKADGDRFVMKGDNNGFVDTFEPGKAEMLGTLWFTVGGVGNWGAWLAEPTHAALATGLVALLSLLGTGLKAERHRRRRRTAAQRSGGLGGGMAKGARPVRSGGAVASGQAVQLAGGLLGIVAVLCGLLALLSFTRSSTRTGDGPAAYAQHGTFAYEAKVPAGAVYENGRLVTGQPAYVQVVRSIRVSFDWSLRTQAEHQVFGTAGLTAEMANGSGWTRTFRLAAPRPFSGDRTTVGGVLRLTELRAIANQLEAVTGQVPDTYTVTIRPAVHLAGAVGGKPVKDDFTPPLALALDRYKLALPTSGSADTLLVRDQDGPASQVLVPRTLSILGWKPQVTAARKLSAIVGLAALVGALGIGLLWLLELRRADEPARIRARFGHLMVEIVEPRRRFAEHDVLMASFEDLVRVADRHARMILHAQTGDTHVYLVEDDGVAYRYEAQAGRRDADPAPGPVLGGDPLGTPPADRSPV